MKLLRSFLSLVLLVCLLAPLCTSGSVDKVYTDVPPGHWAEGVLQKAADYGLMTGGTDGTFGLGRTIHRAEFVTILSRMLRWTVRGEGQTYADVTPDKWYYEAVELAAAAGLVAEPLFRPEEPVTRLEMAQLLITALGFDQIGGQAAETPFFDVSPAESGWVALAYDMGMTTGSPSLGGLAFRPQDTASREEAAAMLVRLYERYSKDREWLHGFYAFSSYDQIDFTARMDGVSVGWARLSVGEDGTPYINDTGAENNEWVKPTDYTDALTVFSDNETPVNLNVFSTDTDAFLTEEARATAVSLLAAAAEPYAGLTMDMEGLKGTEVRTAYTALLTDLRAALPEDKTLFVCVQPDTWYDGFDYRALGDVCDKVILMAHDYQWPSVPEEYVGTDNTQSPVTPITEICRALRAITHPETGVADRSKIALQISFANVGLAVDENGLLADTQIYRPAASTVYTRMEQEDTQFGWSQADMNPYLYYTTPEGGRYRLWYEDARSVEAKLLLARMFDIHSVSLWRLGTIPNFSQRPEFHFNVWDRLVPQTP